MIHETWETIRHWVPYVVVLSLAWCGTSYLAGTAQQLRVNEHPEQQSASGDSKRIADDYTNGLELGRSVIGLAVALAGFFGLAVAGREALVKGAGATAGTSAAVGLGGVLAGASLVEPGEWAIPAALVALIVGGSAVIAARIVQ
jgi:hypothetical protein